ncbi:hypothetical protein DL769_009353 [Monosporascus sp. CRB-8-3]|nr:hypothetical protein DL769_009353 [Monosporascus sp. CRB-8-3]
MPRPNFSRLQLGVPGAGTPNDRVMTDSSSRLGYGLREPWRSAFYGRLLGPVAATSSAWAYTAITSCPLSHDGVADRLVTLRESAPPQPQQLPRLRRRLRRGGLCLERGDMEDPAAALREATSPVQKNDLKVACPQTGAEQDGKALSGGTIREGPGSHSLLFVLFSDHDFGPRRLELIRSSAYRR